MYLILQLKNREVCSQTPLIKRYKIKKKPTKTKNMENNEIKLSSAAKEEL